MVGANGSFFRVGAISRGGEPVPGRRGRHAGARGRRLRALPVGGGPLRAGSAVRRPRSGSTRSAAWSAHVAALRLGVGGRRQRRRRARRVGLPRDQPQPAQRSGPAGPRPGEAMTQRHRAARSDGGAVKQPAGRPCALLPAAAGDGGPGLPAPAHDVRRRSTRRRWWIGSWPSSSSRRSRVRRAERGVRRRVRPPARRHRRRVRSARSASTSCAGGRRRSSPRRPAATDAERPRCEPRNWWTWSAASSNAWTSSGVGLCWTRTSAPVDDRPAHGVLGHRRAAGDLSPPPAARARPSVAVTAHAGRSRGTFEGDDPGHAGGGQRVAARLIVRKDRPIGLLPTKAADEFAVLEGVYATAVSRSQSRSSPTSRPDRNWARARPGDGPGGWRQGRRILPRTGSSTASTGGRWVSSWRRLWLTCMRCRSTNLGVDQPRPGRGSHGGVGHGGGRRHVGPHRAN